MQLTGEEQWRLLHVQKLNSNYVSPEKKWGKNTDVDFFLLKFLKKLNNSLFFGLWIWDPGVPPPVSYTYTNVQSLGSELFMVLGILPAFWPRHRVFWHFLRRQNWTFCNFIFMRKGQSFWVQIIFFQQFRTHRNPPKWPFLWKKVRYEDEGIFKNWPFGRHLASSGVTWRHTTLLKG